MFLFLIVGRLERQDSDTVSLIPAADETTAHQSFRESLREDEMDSRELDLDVSLVVGEYTGVDTVRVPEGTDWHLSTVHPLGAGLPPDPEGENDNRAKWAYAALAVFRRTTRCEQEEMLKDLLCDLMHWADRNGGEFDAALDCAQRNYREETAGDES